MKSFTLIIVFIISFALLTSCSKVENTLNSSAMSGTWNLKMITGGFGGLEDTYNSGVVVWTFNNQQLTVQNNAPASFIYSGLTTGVYPYEVQIINNETYLFIANEHFSGVSFLNNELTLDQNSIPDANGADGFVLLFER